MEDRVEALDRSRRRMLTGFLVAFLAWQVPAIVLAATQIAHRGVAVASSLLAAVAGVVWIVYLVRLLRLQREVAGDPEAALALEDERVRQARARAFAFGFWALSLYLLAARFGAFVVELPTAEVVQAGLVVAAASAIGAFLVYDRG
jgi:hypothetical protein